MDSEQEFCLKWNNHQKTLVSVFDMLLESGTLVDCTLAAEGQYLKAHKVVLSACSPFFQMLLSQHSEQHPIVILKDVTFKELKAMIDYMYRGEVNVSQDQLEALLNAAESLQIKGLFDGREGKAMDKENPSESRANVTMVKETRPTPVDTMDEDSRSLSRRGSSREGSMSPAPRKRRKHRRRSSCGEEFVEGSALLNGHDQASSSSDRSQAAPIASQSVPVALCPVPVLLPLSAGNEIEKPIKHDCFLEQTTISQSTFPPKRESDEAEGLLIPKTECVDNDVGEGSVEDLTLDEDEDDVSMDRAQPGPSSMNEGPIQTYGPWRFDDVSLPVLGPTGSYSKTRGLTVSGNIYALSTFTFFPSLELGAGDEQMGVACPQCGKTYSRRCTLLRHLKLECGVEPQYECRLCRQRFRRKYHLRNHISHRHTFPKPKYDVHLV